MTMVVKMFTWGMTVRPTVTPAIASEIAFSLLKKRTSFTIMVVVAMFLNMVVMVLVVELMVVVVWVMIALVTNYMLYWGC